MKIYKGQIFQYAGFYGKRNHVATATGEFREPKRGELFISGAIPEAYKATNDLKQKYHIAKDVNILKFWKGDKP